MKTKSFQGNAHLGPDTRQKCVGYISDGYNQFVVVAAVVVDKP